MMQKPMPRSKTNIFFNFLHIVYIIMDFIFFLYLERLNSGKIYEKPHNPPYEGIKNYKTTFNYEKYIFNSLKISEWQETTGRD